MGFVLLNVGVAHDGSTTESDIPDPYGVLLPRVGPEVREQQAAVEGDSPVAFAAAAAFVVPTVAATAATVEAPAAVVEVAAPAVAVMEEAVVPEAVAAVAVVEEAVAPEAVAAVAEAAPAAAVVAAAPAAAQAVAAVQAAVPLSVVVAAMVAAAAEAAAAEAAPAAAAAPMGPMVEAAAVVPMVETTATATPAAVSAAAAMASAAAAPVVGVAGVASVAAVAVGEASALNAGGSSSCSKRKVNIGFVPAEKRGALCKAQTSAGRRPKPADFEHADIPAAETTPLKRHTYFLDEADSLCNSNGGSDSECMDVVGSVAEATLAPDSDVDSRSARVTPIPRKSSQRDGASPSPSGIPSSCPAGNPAAGVTNSALCSASSSPGVGEGIGAGESPSVGAGGGNLSGSSVDASAGESAMVGAGGCAVVVSAVGKKGATGKNRKGKAPVKKKKPEAAVKTAEVLDLEAFEKSLQPEPPIHAVVPETPTPWAFLPADQGGPAKELDFSTAAAREALETMVWDRQHFLLPSGHTMEVKSGGSGGGGTDGNGRDVGGGGGGGSGGSGGSAAGTMSEFPDAPASAEAPTCARLLPRSVGRAPSVNMKGPLATPSPTRAPSALGEAAVGGGKTTATIRAGFLNPKVDIVVGTGETITDGGLGMEDDGVSEGLGVSVGSGSRVEARHGGGGCEVGGGEEQSLVAPSRSSPSRPGAKGKGKVCACNCVGVSVITVS